VWELALPGDSRRAWDGRVLDDPRVIQFWDEDRLTAQSLAGFLDQSSAAHPDAYFLFAREAQWKDSPSGLVDFGQNVIGRSDELKRALAPLIR
jgi:hypothetical protein